jgi:hypothetical protein
VIPSGEARVASALARVQSLPTLGSVAALRQGDSEKCAAHCCAKQPQSRRSPMKRGCKPIFDEIDLKPLAHLPLTLT